MECGRVSERQIRHPGATMPLEIRDVRRARREDPIVLVQGVHEPRCAVRRVPGVIGQVIHALRAEPADFPQRSRCDRRQARRQHALRLLCPACLDEAVAELT